MMTRTQDNAARRDTLVHLLADSTPANSVAVIFNSLGGLGGFVVAVIGVLIFIRDSKKKPRRKTPPRKHSGASNDHRSRPPQRKAPPPEDEEPPDEDDELPEDEDSGDAPGGYTSGEPIDS
jgi:hypothetical protein